MDEEYTFFQGSGGDLGIFFRYVLSWRTNFTSNTTNQYRQLSRQKLRLLAFAEIRNAIDELYVCGAFTISGGRFRAREMQPYKLVAGLGPRRLCTYGRLSRSIA